PALYKEICDPLYHYTRGVLFFDEKCFRFTAYRLPYQELDSKSWETEREFTEDYRSLIARKYSGVEARAC
ncbi:MAG: hypothetical protein WBS20_01080, partial [Lysobacterales bacterium]